MPILKKLVCISFVAIVNVTGLYFGLSANDRPLIDAHIHYSHDAWQKFPPEEAVKLLRTAGLKHAFVSSSNDEGTQKLVRIAPDLILPVLRPYRRRGETGSWKYDETVIDMLTDRLSNFNYYGIGEFHAFGDDIDLPVLQSVIKLAKRYGIFLHAHSDAEAVKLIFKSNPDALVVWAHSGFDDPEVIRPMLETYPNLWSDLAFRSDFEINGVVSSDWKALFKDFPNRFLLGTDTYTPERWYYVIEQADWSRQWLNSLPTELADRIAHKNAESLVARIKQ
jgi:hypothetical protein